MKHPTTGSKQLLRPLSHLLGLERGGWPIFLWLALEIAVTFAPVLISNSVSVLLSNKVGFQELLLALCVPAPPRNASLGSS